MEALRQAVSDLVGNFKPRTKASVTALKDAAERYVAELEPTPEQIRAAAIALIDDERQEYFPKAAELRARLRIAVAADRREDVAPTDRSRRGDLAVVWAWLLGLKPRLVDHPYLADPDWKDADKAARPAFPTERRLDTFVQKEAGSDALEELATVCRAALSDEPSVTARADRLRMAISTKTMLKPPLAERAQIVVTVAARRRAASAANTGAC